MPAEDFPSSAVAPAEQPQAEVPQPLTNEIVPGSDASPVEAPQPEAVALPPTAEQASIAPENAEATELKAKISELLRRAHELGDDLYKGGSQQDSLTLEDTSTTMGNSLRHQLVTTNPEGSRTELFDVSALSNGLLRVQKEVRTDGKKKGITVSQNLTTGELKAELYNGTGTLTQLGPEQVQPLVDNVMGDLARVLEEKEQSSTSNLDADIADILGEPKS